MISLKDHPADDYRYKQQAITTPRARETGDETGGEKETNDERQLS
jgi:hypothetical protein